MKSTRQLWIMLQTALSLDPYSQNEFLHLNGKDIVEKLKKLSEIEEKDGPVF